MKFCKNCSATMSDEAEFCPNCGNRVEQGFEPEAKAEVVAPNNISGIKKRNIILAILFTIITCGLYGFYWQVKINDETLELSNEHGSSGVMVLLLTIITCGIYGYYWYYKMGNCGDKMRGNLNGNTGFIYILLAGLGLGIVNICLIQSAVNDVVEEK